MKKQYLTGCNIVREKIRIRDNYTCQLCGKFWFRGMRRLDVHHIDCDKDKTKKYDDIFLEHQNMITLCHHCHLLIHYNLNKCQDFFLWFKESHENDYITSNGEIKWVK